MYSYGDRMGIGGWSVMVISMVLFWTAMVLLVFALIRHLNRAPHHEDHGHGLLPGSPQGPRAEQVLAERFARDDIDEDEYRRRQRTLRETGS